MEVTMFDYQFVTTLPNGQIRTTTYQNLVRVLGLENEVVQGQPLKEGGAPQALWLKQMLEEVPAFKGCTVAVYFNGNQIF